jgi:hypothetical protein
LDQSNQEQELVVPFHAFDLIVPKEEARASGVPLYSPFNSRTIIFLDCNAVLSVLEWAPYPLTDFAVLEGFKVFQDKKGEKTVAMFSPFMPNFPLIPLRRKRPKPGEYIALTRFEDSTVMFSLILEGSTSRSARAAELSRIIKINLHQAFLEEKEADPS